MASILDRRTRHASQRNAANYSTGIVQVSEVRYEESQATVGSSASRRTRISPTKVKDLLDQIAEGDAIIHEIEKSPGSAWRLKR